MVGSSGDGEGPRKFTREEILRMIGAMPTGLRSMICNMATFLTQGVVFSVPPFQRPYSWSEEHVEKLIQDLLNNWIRNGNFYYIGHLVVIASARVSEYRIADGQQRLATITMILAYVRDRLQERGAFLQALITDLGRIKLRPKDEGFFQEFVQTPGNFSRLAGLENAEALESQVRMCAAAETITTALEDMTVDELERFAKFICRAALFNVTYCDEPGGAALIFKTVNDSGLELSYADLLKFALLENAEGMSDEAKEEAARKWEALEDKLGREAFGELLLMAPLMFSGTPIRAPGDLMAFAQHLFAHSSVQSFLTEWLPAHGAALIAVLREEITGPHAEEINRRIACLKLLKDQTWRPLVVSFLANHGHEAAKLKRFVRGVDLIAFGALLGSVRPEARELRWTRALAAGGDEAKLFNSKDGPLALNDNVKGMSERDRFVERLGATFKREHKRDSEKRCLLLIRINACLPGGEVLKRLQGLTVEHILPAKGGAAWSGAFTASELQFYPHVLGNWTLVQHEQNVAAGAKAFAEKKAVYLDKQYPIHAITRLLEGTSEWTPREINLRTQQFQKALFDDWGI
ncbi:MAG: DUF262 domain-containing protein [Hyphomonadaceae bacterium]|nr:DUF262 domain-containing protein [Hyphomonadaceae bacterium]